MDSSPLPDTFKRCEGCGETFGSDDAHAHFGDRSPQPEPLSAATDLCEHGWEPAECLHEGYCDLRDNGPCAAPGCNITREVLISHIDARDETIRKLTEEKATLQRERDKAETTLEMINALATGYGWLSEGRGSYEWDDGRYDDDVRLFTSQLLELLPSGNWLGFPEWEAQYRRLEAEVTGLRAALEDMVHECDRTIAWRKGGVRPATDTSIFSASALSSVIKVRRAFVAALGDAPQPAPEPDAQVRAVDIARMAGNPLNVLPKRDGYITQKWDGLSRPEFHERGPNEGGTDRE